MMKLTNEKYKQIFDEDAYNTLVKFRKQKKICEVKIK